MSHDQPNNHRDDADREDRLIDAAFQQESAGPGDRSSPGADEATKSIGDKAMPEVTSGVGGVSPHTVMSDGELDSTELREVMAGPTVPDSIPGYEIVREIHRGGQGVVYQALQKATKRKVAIKVMREGPFASRKDIVRFEREVEVLGQLKHPNLVAIHDSGTASGSFYYVMDYISGQPLDVWMASKERPIEDVLRLFVQICEAVNAAHLRGVIHRDLKPGNIRIDAEGQPHILDFGLAKVAHGVEEASLMTMTGQFVGSLPWASPEQAEGAPSKIDTRTDVYSLGVVLYQMLTGKFPYDVVGNMRDVLDRIMNTAPTRPSTIRRQINDEVETIVLRCLSKERDRRYQTAGELARDIGHYLNGEPIEAKRDSALYVLRKSLRRHKVPVAVAGGIVALIVGAAVAFMVMAQKNRLLAGAERAARIRAEAATTQVAAERDRADQKAAEALEQKRAAELQVYIANIASVNLALRLGDIDIARARLDACSEDLRGWEWRHLNASSDKSLVKFRTDSFFSAAFSPDGKRIVTGSSFEKIPKVWDARMGQEITALRGHTDEVRTAAFSPDGTRIVTGSFDTTGRIWDARTGQESATLRGHTDRIISAAYGPDGTRIITASQDGTAKLWDARTGRELATLRGHVYGVWSAAFSPDGTQIVTGSADSTAKVWNTKTGQELVTLRGHADCVSSAAFSPDGKRIVTASRDETAKIWDAATGQELTTLRGHKHDVYSAAFSPDGKWIVTASRDVRFWDSTSGQELATLPACTGSAVFSPDGTLILTAGARLWDAATRQTPVTLRGHTGSVYSATFSPDGKCIVTASQDKTAKIWDAATGQELATLRGHTGEVRSATFSPDGTQIITGSFDKTAKLWDARTGRELATLRGHTSGVWPAAFSRDGTRIVTASYDNTARLWDARTTQELATLRGHTTWVRSAAFSPDGTRIVTGSCDGSAKVWETRTAQELATLRGHTSFVCSAAFSPDGTRIVTGSFDATARIWNAGTGQELATLRGHTLPVNCVTFSPDGKRVATASEDKTTSLWEPDSARELVTLYAHRDPVHYVAFSPDGAQLLTASGDRTVMIWDTMPYVQRYRERQAAFSAAKKARPMVAELHDHLSSWSRVAEVVCKDTNLDEQVRQQASNQVLEFASAESAGQRARAADLNNAAWEVVKDPGRTAGQYRKAHEQAQEASELIPQDAGILNTLGIAKFRVAAYEGALATLKLSDELNSGIPANVAFIAMVHYQLGHATQATTAFERLGKLMQGPNVPVDEESEAFYEEASALLGVPATEWDVRFFKWSPGQDPREHEDKWNASIAGEPVARSKVRAIDFSWHRGSPQPDVPADYFSVVATSSINLRAGRYWLRTLSDDGIRVWLDDRRVIDNWTPHSTMEDVAMVELKDGEHRMRVEYFEITVDARLCFRMGPLATASSSAPSTQIPTSRQASGPDSGGPIAGGVHALRSNLLVNPSFTDGLWGWVNASNPTYYSANNAYPAPKTARDGATWVGSSSAYDKGTKTPELRQVVTVTPGTKYLVSVWAHTEGSPKPCTAYLEWKDGRATRDGQGATLATLAGEPPPGPGWHQLKGVVTPTGSTLTIILKLSWDSSGPGGGGNFDLAEVREVGAEEAPQTQAASQPGR